MAKAVTGNNPTRTTRTARTTATKKATATTATSTRTRNRKQEAATAAVPTHPSQLTPEDRERMVREAAYYIAEQDGFGENRELDYWLQAEIQVEQLLAARAAETH